MQCKPRCQGAVSAFLFAFDLHKSQSRLNFATLPRPSPWASAAARESQRAEQPKQVARKPHTVPPARKLSKNKQHHVRHVDPSPSTGECTQAHSHSLTHAAHTKHQNTKSERGEHQKKLTRNTANKASNWATEPRRRRQRRRTLCRALYKINWAFLLEFIKRFTAQLDVATIRPTTESRVRQPESATQSESDSVSEAHTQNLHSVPCWHQVQHPIRIVPSALFRFVRLALQENNQKQKKEKKTETKQKKPKKTELKSRDNCVRAVKRWKTKSAVLKKKQENSKKKRINI